jgi:3-mercaptopropionate dioxygenase
MDNIARLRTFIVEFTRLADRARGVESVFLGEGRPLLQELISVDDWLPQSFSTTHPVHYQQYLLHCDPLERFSVVSFVWDGGQRTPIHNHTVWGLVGILRGAETTTRYSTANAGQPPKALGSERLEAGAIDVVSPTVGDVHRVSNAFEKQVSISIHVYGANIGAVRRNTFDDADGAPREFVSGYASRVIPNLWARSV